MFSAGSRAIRLCWRSVAMRAARFCSRVRAHLGIIVSRLPRPCNGRCQLGGGRAQAGEQQRAAGMVT
jgi:hypothetical protein